MHASRTVSDGRASRRRALQRRIRRTRLLSFLLTPALVLGVIGAGVWTATTAAAAPLPAPTATIGLQETGDAYGDADPKPFILAGEDATFDVSLSNNSETADGYNIAFSLALPVGIDFVPTGGGLPLPTVYGPGDELPNSSKTPPLPTVPAGMQLWVFEDIADLPARADYASTITVRPNAAVFPVGAAPQFSLTGYVSSQPALKPIFDGSTGVGGSAALLETSSGDDSTTAPVRALRLTKDEPSPEIELLRGVHDHQTTYTLTIENTPQGVTDGVTVVDHLPAGLEFLGCGTTDNTRPSSLLYGAGSDREYPGADTLEGATPDDCLEPVSVETVDSGLPADLPAGVYTRVTWELPPLAGATAQTFPGTAGTPGVTTISYLAAVPLFENTMEFVSDDGAGTPSAVSGEQGSNLNNNSGASTRQGLAAGFNDGIEYTNSATVSGTYTGVAPVSSPVPASDTDTERIQAMDLRILKSVSTGAGDDDNDFVTGGLATFRLELDASEYTSADRMVVTDVLPNGLCPALPAHGGTVSGTWPADCVDPWPGAGAVLTNAEVSAIDYDAETGQFTVSFIPDPDAIAANGTLDIFYTAFMRPSYTDDEQYVGNTSSGDSLINEVDVEGWTTSIAALDGVNNGDGVPAFGEDDVWDDSSAEIVSQFSTIAKRVLSRGAVIETDPAAPTAASSCAVPTGDTAWQPDHIDPLADEPFVPGDVVCYELVVNYAPQIDVRNPLVTDFLPTGVSYLDSTIAGGTTPGLTVAPANVDGQRIDWEVGTPGADGDRFVPQGARLILHVLGRVTSWTPNNEAELDKPQNLMKYQQEDVEGDVFFDRDASAILTGQGPTLLKGVRDVDGNAGLPARSQANTDGTVFESNRDGISVVQGDVVTYRVDLTGGTSAVEDLVVWDALPEGVTADDVTAVSAGGTALDPSDGGYPAGELPSAYAGRSVIVWTGLSLDAAQELTLDYDVTIPDDALVNVTFENTASITRFDLPSNAGGATTVYPTDSLDAAPPGGAETVPGTGMRDDSNVYTPEAPVTKAIVSSEVSPATNNLDPSFNDQGQIVQGELVTYDYSVTIPAHTSVEDAVLRDRGTLTPGNVAFAATDGSWTASALTGAVASDFTFQVAPGSGTARGVLTFPTTYQNSSNVDQVFTVTLIGYVGDAGGNNTTLTNQAQFTSETWDRNATATVVYREPNPQIVKTATPTEEIAIGTPVEYTLTVSNPGRVKSYDNLVTDTVPVGLEVDPASFNVAPASVEPGVEDGLGGDIVWNIAEIPASATLTYTATISPDTGAGTAYTNTAEIVGYTLPLSLGGDVEDRRGERTDSDDATVEAVTAELEKGVHVASSAADFAPTASAPIGETMEYEVEATLLPNINYYDVRIVDDLLPGAVLVESTGVEPVSSDPDIDGTWTRTHDAASNTWTWSYDEPITSSTTPRTLTLTYRVDLTNAISGASVPNTAAFSWAGSAGGTRSSIDDSATVTVLNPVAAIDKVVSDAAPDPGEEFDYTVTVTNTGNTPAHNLEVVDTVPAGIVIQEGSITRGGLPSSGALAGTGGTITWDATDLPGPLHPQSSAEDPRSIVLTYSAELAPSATIGDAQSFTNTATVTRMESFDEGGRVYTPNVSDTAVVDPAFPNVALTKTPTAGDTAYAGQPFGWTLTLVNTGDGPAETIEVTDVLPDNWEYDAGSAQIRVGTGAAVALANPDIDQPDDVQTLTWDADAVSATTPALPGTASGATAAQRTIVITFTATPTEEALVDAGVTTDQGVRVPHVNTLDAVTTDTSDATGNADGDYTGPEDTADAFIHSADVELIKTAGSGLVAGGPAAPAWTIEVRNDGPDTAVGPFEVTDDWGTLPAGFTVTGVAGTGWTCGAPGASGFTCERTNAADTLAADASFPAITVTAQAAASFDLANSPVGNEASVTATTFDPDENNNSDEDEVPVTANADLAITKTGPATAPNAGGPIAWTVTLTNNGPSDSLSTTGDGNTITITDTIPAGVNGVTLGTLPAGWSATGSGPWNAGDTVTLTLAAGERMTPTQSAAFVLTGTVSPSLVPGTPIANTAVVDAGATPDPVTPNNSSETSTTPTADTSLSVTKVRQVFDNGAWRDATATDETVPGTPVTYLLTVANVGTADARGVTLTDEVPDYLTYTSFEDVAGTWTRVGGTAAGDDQVFTLGADLAPAASASLRITLSIPSSYDEDVVNWVEADAANSTNSPRADSDSGSTRSANLTIVKSHTDTAVAGSTLEYRLAVTNAGPSYSSGPIVITDTLPAGFSLLAGSAAVSIAGGPGVATAPVVSGQTLTWTIGDGDFELANSAGIVIDFTAAIDQAVAAGTYDNVGSVDGPDDTDPSDNSDTDPTDVAASADLSVTKTASAASYIAGEEAQYSVDVTNSGPSMARNVSLVDTVPAGMTVTAMSGTGWTCVVATATCTLPELPVGTSTVTVTAAIAASVAEGTSLTNIATVTSSTPDPTGPVTDDETVTVTTLADLAIVKTAVDTAGVEITTAVAGTDVRYLLEVTNVGPSDAVGPLQIADALPAGFSYVSVAEGASAWTCALDPADASALACENPSGLAAGAAATDLVITVAIDPAQPVGTSVNVAAVTSATTDPTPGNNTDDAALAIAQSADLSIVKSHDAAEVHIDDEVTFELEVTSDGSSTASAVTVTDTLPAGLAYVDEGGSDAAWSVVAAPPGADGTTTVTATLDGALAPATVAPPLEIVARVLVGAYPEVTNVAAVAAAQPDPDPSGNTDEDEVVVPPLAALVLTKVADGPLQVGENGSYTLTLTNTGLTEDPGPIVIEDVLPAGLIWQGAGGAGVTCADAAGTVSCELDDALAVGASVSVTLDVAVGIAAFPEVSNTASVRTPTEQTAGAQLSATATSAVTAKPLPPTGGDVPAMWIALGTMLALGGVLLLVARRRRTT
ncbi:isopeptide-forming domain-containing fimbrial protein [Microbacterium sp. RD1]|uniref:isopeptide-forming domain-containing fimbrial protein n=1 Tax=Microbacterium sp. RD1 TaxID=3457313 RepID=UPI003FA59560